MSSPESRTAREKAAEALARGLPVADAAKAAGLHVNSVYRLKKTPLFEKLLEKAREKLKVEQPQALEDRSEAERLAVATWASIARDPTQSARDRIKAGEWLWRYAQAAIDEVSDSTPAAAPEVDHDALRARLRAVGL